MNNKKILFLLPFIALTISACATKGEQGVQGEPGINGQDGRSVVSIVKTSSDGNVDTYTITYSDGTTSTFTVTNGKDGATGQPGADGHTPTVTIGENGNWYVDGKDTGIRAQAEDGQPGKDGTNLLTGNGVPLNTLGNNGDTYIDLDSWDFYLKINDSWVKQGNVKGQDGEDGKTPYIGENGNWWIGNQDTGVLADYERANDIGLTFYSDGLTYTAVTYGGKSGFAVSGWNQVYSEESGLGEYTKDEIDYLYGDGLKESHLVIPNYIGSVPVIGIADNVKLNFKKVTLSKNTLFLGKDTFADSTYLNEIDFHSCQISSIPYECFKNSAITDIKIPDTVTYIADYAFSGVKLSDFNFSNIAYIGKQAFDSYEARYVYLPKTVTYVGNKAFYMARVYIENEIYPSTWDATIIDTSNNVTGLVTTNCKENDNYIYSVIDSEVTVFQYIGKDKSISIPDSIDEYPVTKIGFGFNTNLGIYRTITDYSQIEDYVTLREVILPDTVTTIEYFALCGFGTMVFATSSLKTISESFANSLEYDDDCACLKLKGAAFSASNHLFLEGDSFPDIVEKGGTKHSYTKDTIDSSSYRVSFGITYSTLETDDNFYYQNDGDSYSIVAYKGLKTQNLVIPSSINGKAVYTLLRKAIDYDQMISSIKIEDGISKIRPFSIMCAKSVASVLIPLSVTIINAYGICIESDAKIYIKAASKPLDWDSNWTNKLDNAVYGVDGEIKSNNFFLYFESNGAISLLSYLSTSLRISIPTEIDEIPVTTIKSGFLSLNSGATIYIPSSITKVESKSFVNKSTNTFHFYLEDSSIQSGWSSEYYYNSSSKSSSSYVSCSWKQASSLFEYTYNDNYAYYNTDDGIELVSFSGNTNTVKIPRTIANKNVIKIYSYCFEFSNAVEVYIPSEITTIQECAIELYYNSSVYTDVYCEAKEKPSGYNSYFVYNSKYDSQAYISIKYGQNIGY